MLDTQKIMIVKIVYLIGAILDILVGLDYLIAFWFGQSLAVFIPAHSTDILAINSSRYSDLQLSTFMLGWGLMLFWGYKKPIERRLLLMITAFPVLSGLLLSNFFALYVGLAELSILSMNIVVQVVIFICLVAAFVSAESQRKNT